jgi:hypothetical protein
MLRNSVVKVVADQVSCDLAGETVILGLKHGEYYGLNEVGSRIWNLIQEPKTVAELLDAMLKEYDVAFDQVEPDLLAVLEQMADKELITIEDSQ